MHNYNDNTHILLTILHINNLNLQRNYVEVWSRLKYKNVTKLRDIEDLWVLAPLHYKDNIHRYFWLTCLSLLLCITAAFQKNAKSAPVTCSNSRNGRSVSLDGVTFSEGELLLQVKKQNKQQVYMCTDSMCCETCLCICIITVGSQWLCVGCDSWWDDLLHILNDPGRLGLSSGRTVALNTVQIAFCVVCWKEKLK